ncbi:MAG: aldehyde ferredoxin oxidoreductase family protein [Sulfolobales archaeon]|nr:aldehyde ferredoxin oxidoreductase family protein [Sulfolobales archaeon]MDW8083406.1 aldehyde ferredoxin oxidoreductase family protein [Sulfolobales archaeon]
MNSWIKTLSRTLYLDLSRKQFWIEERDDLFSKWLGGTGVAIQLYREESSRRADPLGPENVVVFAIGPLTGVFPMASKVVSVFKSPLNGYVTESHAGGRAATAIRYAGYGAIVIKGSSDMPVYIVIDEEKVRFRDAGALWGMRSSETVGKVLREAMPGAGYRTIMRIGRAGEKLVRFSNLTVETYRHFGRMGLGAVFGSKKLKALVIIGRKGFKLPNPRAYREVYREIYELTKGPATRKYHDLGTAANIIPLDKLGALPTRNFSSGRFDGAREISGEKLAEDNLSRRLACTACPVACIHLAAIREEYEDEKYFYKTEFVPYDHEPIYALGSNLGISDRYGLLKLIKVVEDEGLDSISTGVVLSWATEAFERELISIKDTLVELRWGNWRNYVKAVTYIVLQPNEFYATLALGVEEAALKYGGVDFALAFNRVEPAGYHTGPLYHSSLAIGFRHSHLDAGAYSIDQSLVASGTPVPSPEEAAKMIIEEESWRQILNSMVVCLFARGAYSKNIVEKALKALGYEIDESRLVELGKQIYLEKHAVKLSEGFEPEKMRIPKRVLETPTPLGNIPEEYVRKVVRHYIKLVREYIEKVGSSNEVFREIDSTSAT